MVNFIRSIVVTATIKQTGITFTGTIINGLLGALFYTICARFLGPADFGLLVVVIMFLTMVVDISDLGIDTGTIRFVSKYWENEKDKAIGVINLVLRAKLLISLVVVAIGLLFTDFISVLLFNKTELTTPLRLSFLGIMGFHLYSLSISLFQSLQMFWVWSGLQVFTNALRIITLVILLFFGKLNLTYAVVVYISLPFLGFLFALIFLPKIFNKPLEIKETFNEFYHYSKWVAVSNLMAAVSARLDTFITARLLTATEVGFYAAANQLTMAVPQIIGALGTVIAPKMAGMGSRKDFVAYLKKTQLLVTGLVGLGLLSLPLVIYLIPLIYGQEYASSVPLLFSILFIAMLVFLLATPLHTAIFYYYGYSKMFTWLSMLHLLIVAIVGWNLVILYGAIGAAITVLIAMVVNFLISALWVVKELRKKDE